MTKSSFSRMIMPCSVLSLAITGAIVCVLAQPLTASALTATPTPGVAVVSVVIVEGDPCAPGEITLAVRVDENQTTVSGYNFALLYPEHILEYVPLSLEPGDFVGVPQIVGGPHTFPGRLTVSGGYVDSQFQTGVLFLARFAVVSATSEQFSIGLVGHSSPLFVGEDAIPFEIDVTATTELCDGPTATPTNTPEVSATPTHTRTYTPTSADPPPPPALVSLRVLDGNPCEADDFFTLGVLVSENDIRVGSYAFRIVFDPDLVAYVPGSAAAADFLQPPGAGTSVAGSISLNAVHVQSQFRSGVLCTVVFQVVAAPVGTYGIEIQPFGATPLVATHFVPIEHVYDNEPTDNLCPPAGSTNTPTRTITPTFTFTSTFTVTNTPTQTYTPSQTHTPTQTPTITNTFTPSNTPPNLVTMPVRTFKVVDHSDPDPEPTQVFYSLEFSPDGTRLAAGYVRMFAGFVTYDAGLAVWDIDSGEELSRSNELLYVQLIRFLPTGEQLMTSGWFESAMLWDAESGALIRTFEEGSQHVGESSIALSADGAELLTGSYSGRRVARWDVATGALLKSYEVPSQLSSTWFVGFSPDQTKVVAALGDSRPVGDEPSVFVWDVDDATVLSSHFPGVQMEFPATMIPGTMKLLGITGPEPRDVLVFDIETDQVVARFSDMLRFGPHASLTSVVVSNDGHLAATGHADGGVILWDLIAERELYRFLAPKWSVLALGISPDKRYIVAGSNVGPNWQMPGGHIALFKIPDFIWGDLNGNGIAGTLDASLILRWDAFAIDAFPAYADIVRPDYPPAADVSGDGVLGALDAAHILQYDTFMRACFEADENCDRFGPE